MALEQRSPAVLKSDPMSTSLQETRLSRKDSILLVASNMAAQALQNFEPEVWGVLTAISATARKRIQGKNIILTADEHRFGRLVLDKPFQIEAASVSANHCKIYRKNGATIGSDHHLGICGSVLLKDTSTNGTYLNWEKLTKNGPEAEIRHGDIISFANPPDSENSLAFVFREVLKSATGADGVAKRKAGTVEDSSFSPSLLSYCHGTLHDVIMTTYTAELGHESKRLKGIGIGAPDGPLSLDDFRSLQRSNTELRKQLENHVSTIDLLRNENRALIEDHENKINEMKESFEQSYSKQLLELHQLIEVGEKDLDASNKTLSEQKHLIDDLSERLTACNQSLAEAKEIMVSQKASISEMKKQLDDEREQRREEREKAAADLKAAVLKAQSEAEEEFKRLSEASCRRYQEQQEVINKLQESEKERCLLVDTLRTKLEDSRQKLIASEHKVRQLETQLTEERVTSSNNRKRIEELDDELKTMKKKLESEKSAREDAWAKVSVLELQISAALRDLEYERRRLRGARERIILRETQLRAFYSTTEEISSLFAKQQEQLKAMQKTLEDEENYASDSAEIDLNAAPGDAVGNLISGNKQMQCKRHSTDKAGSSTSANNNNNIQVDNSSDNECGTEKHDCDHKTQEEFQSTQEVDSANGGEVPALEGGDPIGTEQVPDTESSGADKEQNHYPNVWVVLAGETMQVDDEIHDKETEEFAQVAMKSSEFSNRQGNQGGGLCTETVAIRTQDLLASEAAGSTAPLAHAENDSSGTGDNNDENGGHLPDSSTIVAESQCSLSPEGDKRKKDERRELSEMIGIVAPELKEHFKKANMNPNNQKETMWSNSNSDSEGVCSDDDENDGFRVEANGRVMVDSGTDHASDEDSHERSKSGDAMDEDEEGTENDSVG
ncbi:unnamed protein product [Rhodiola kirilowii]